MKHKIKQEFEHLVNVAASNVGARVIFANDEFFAKAQRMLQVNNAIFIEDKFDDNGKWMDGWETRRRRDGGNDFCFVKLGFKSIIKGFDVDTAHFTGNYAPAISITGCCVDATISDDEVVNNEDDFEWVDLLNPSNLTADAHHFFDVAQCSKVTHLKITLYPDGGIARLKAYAQVCFDEALYQQDSINVVSISTGARAIYANDEHFGCLQNILLDSEPLNMADGWETRRRREPGNDWGVIALAKPAVIDNIVVDTQFFKGNYPDSFSIDAGYHQEVTDSAVITHSMFWQTLITPQKLTMNHAHLFAKSELSHQKAITHIRFNIFPDGGIARLKLMGRFVK